MGRLEVAKPSILDDIAVEADEDNALDGETGGNIDLGNLFDEDIDEDLADAKSGEEEDVLDATDLLDEDSMEMSLDDDDFIMEEDGDEKG